MIVCHFHLGFHGIKSIVSDCSNCETYCSLELDCDELFNSTLALLPGILGVLICPTCLKCRV